MLSATHQKSVLTITFEFCIMNFEDHLKTAMFWSVSNLGTGQFFSGD